MTTTGKGLTFGRYHHRHAAEVSRSNPASTQAALTDTAIAHRIRGRAIARCVTAPVSKGAISRIDRSILLMNVQNGGLNKIVHP